MLEQYYNINEATGISIAIKQDGTTAVNACSISIASNKLNFEKKLTDISSIEGLSQQLPKKTIIALNLSGKGVLQKQIEKIENIDQNNFSQVLPNARLEDFYIQNFVSGSKSFISVVRKTEADKYINQLIILGHIPLTLSLGPFPVQNIIPQLNIYGNSEIKFDGNTISTDEQGTWDAVQYDDSVSSPFTLKVESETMSEKLIVPYAVAFQLVLAHKVDLIEAKVLPLQTALKKLLDEKKLKVQGSVILCVFFVLLLVNLIIFSWLNSNNAKLVDEVSRSAQSTEDVQAINNNIQQKELLLKNLGWEENINKSILIDQVASMVPQDITWNQAEIDPIDLTQSRNQKSVTFSMRKIRITGNSDKIIPVNEWIARIKTRPWVKDVQLDSYTVNNELNTGQFIILIYY